MGIIPWLGCYDFCCSRSHNRCKLTTNCYHFRVCTFKCYWQPMTACRMQSKWLVFVCLNRYFIKCYRLRDFIDFESPCYIHSRQIIITPRLWRYNIRFTNTFYSQYIIFNFRNSLISTLIIYSESLVRFFWQYYIVIPIYSASYFGEFDGLWSFVYRKRYYWRVSRTNGIRHYAIIIACILCFYIFNCILLACSPFNSNAIVHPLICISVIHNINRENRSFINCFCFCWRNSNNLRWNNIVVVDSENFWISTILLKNTIHNCTLFGVFFGVIGLIAIGQYLPRCTSIFTAFPILRGRSRDGKP